VPQWWSIDGEVIALHRDGGFVGEPTVKSVRVVEHGIIGGNPYDE
jgi:hypothetical protein